MYPQHWCPLFFGQLSEGRVTDEDKNFTNLKKWQTAKLRSQQTLIGCLYVMLYVAALLLSFVTVALESEEKWSEGEGQGRELGVRGQSISCPFGWKKKNGFICFIIELVWRQNLSSLQQFCTGSISLLLLLYFPTSPPYWPGVRQVSLIYYVLWIFFLVARDLFCKTKLDMMTSFIFGEHAATYAIYSR